jgi:hypothetical protein
MILGLCSAISSGSAAVPQAQAVRMRPRKITRKSRICIGLARQALRAQEKSYRSAPAPNRPPCFWGIPWVPFSHKSFIPELLLSKSLANSWVTSVEFTTVIWRMSGEWLRCRVALAGVLRVILSRIRVSRKGTLGSCRTSTGFTAQLAYASC